MDINLAQKLRLMQIPQSWDFLVIPRFEESFLGHVQGADDVQILSIHPYMNENVLEKQR